MIRMLLTLLALMSGLAAAGSPASARLYEGEAAQVGEVLAVSAASRISAHVVAHGRAMVRPVAPALAAPPAMPLADAPARVPVLAGIERARE